MKNNFQKGYTLVEMITVIAIIVIAAGIFANFGSSQRQLALQRDVYTFAQNVRRIQQMAGSISTVTNCATLVPRNGYGIFVAKDADKYMLYANCDCFRDPATKKCVNPYDKPENGDYDKTEALMNAPIKLSNQVKIKSIKGKKGTDPEAEIEGVVILYQPPDPVVQLYGPGDVLLDTITVEFELMNNISRIVEINRAGLVNVKQPK